MNVEQIALETRDRLEIADALYRFQSRDRLQ